MNKKIIACITSLLMCVAVGAFVGCTDGDTSSSSKPQTQTEAIAEMEDFTLGFGTSYEIITNAENLEWQSSNQNVATVTQEGVVFGMGIGEATITVTNGVQTLSCKVTVATSNVVPEYVLNSDDVQLTKGNTYALESSVVVAGVVLDYVTFTYQSSNAAVATVDDNGVITALDYGETDISVSYEAGGRVNTAEVKVNVIEDIIFELNQLEVTLAVEEIAEGKYKSETDIYVTELRLEGNEVPVNQATFAIADDTVVSFDGTTLTALKAGKTTLTATYKTERSTVTIEVPVNVVREIKRYEGTGSVDVAWDDMMASSNEDYAYIELPYSLQLIDDDILYITDREDRMLSENQGLSLPITAMKKAKATLRAVTETLVYEFDVTMDTSYIKLTKSDYAKQFTSPQGVKVKALNEEKDGRTDVIETETPKDKNSNGDTISHVWYNHCGFLNFATLKPTFERGIFIFDVKAEEGTHLAGYVGSQHFVLDATKLTFTLPSNIIKIVDENFNETTFQYGEWNTVVVDYTQIEDSPQFAPSFDGGDLSKTENAYYSNMRYMEVDAYEKLSNQSYGTYTVTFEMGYEELDFAPQEIDFRDNVDTSELDIGGEYKFKAWACNDLLVEDLANLYVTEDITLTAIYDVEYNYEVRYFQRQINGSYKEEDSYEGRDKMFEKVTAESKTYEGYTYNETFSKSQGRVLMNDALVLACYYENDEYTFQANGFGSLNGAKIKKEALTGVDETVMQPNTYKMTPTKSTWDAAFSLSYSADKVGKYLVMKVYVPTDSNVGAPVAWLTEPYRAIPMYYYDESGNILTSVNNDNARGKWTTYVLPIPEDDKKNNVKITFSQHNTYTWYIGEYIFLDQEQFNENFECRVTFDTGLGSKVDLQRLKYGDKIAEVDAPTWVGHEFLYWTTENVAEGTCYAADAQDKPTAYDVNTAVTGDLTLRAVWKCLATETEYTVNHYLRQMNGAYALDATLTQTLKGTLGHIITAAPVQKEGYTPNADLNAITAKGMLTEDTTFNVYYENNAYTFETQAIKGHGGATSTKKAMENVAPTDMRGNTYFLKKTAADAETMLSFTYDADDVGKYLVLNVYYTKMTKLGFQLWDANNGTDMSNVWYYDANGELLQVNDDSLLNQWVSIVIYLDATRFPQDKTTFSISFFHWCANELYFGEYFFLNEETYDKNYEHRVTFDTGLGSKVESQALKYGDKIAEVTPTLVGHEFLYWTTENVAEGTCYADGAQDKPIEYNVNTEVTGDLTLRAVWKCLAEEAQYTVNHYIRTVYGTYELDENFTGGDEALLGHIIEVEPAQKEGYTPNADLNAITAKGMLTEGATFNLYYENDAYKFETQNFARYEANTSTVTKKALTGVAATDMQANTYEVVQTTADGHADFWVSYPQEKVDQYLVMSVYYTKKSTSAGLGGWYVWSSNDGTYTAYGYSIDGKLLPGLTDGLVLNKWVNVVVKVPTTSDNRLKITLSQYAADSWYLGEYTFISETQFKDNFEQVKPIDNSLTGVAHYKGSALINSQNTYRPGMYSINDIITGRASSNPGYIYYSLKVNGINSYTAGQYVVARIMPSVANAVISFEGATREIYTEEGEFTTTPTAYSWHYYVFNVTTGGASDQWLRSFRFNTGDVVFISDVYVMENHEAFSAFCGTKFSNGFVYETTAWQKRTAAKDYVSINEHGYLVYKNKGDNDYWLRGIYLNRSWTAGQYVAIEMYTDSTWNNGTKYGQWWGAASKTVYDKETKQVITDYSTSGKWCIVVFKMNTISAANSDWNNNVSFFQGGVAGDTVLIGKTYVFNNEAAFNTWFNA